MTDSSYTLLDNDTIDVLVYNLALTGSNTIDPNACSTQSSQILFNVSAAPSPTILATNIVGNTFCSGETVAFSLGTLGAVVSPTMSTVSMDLLM